MNRVAIDLLAALLCASCRSPAPKAVARARDRAVVAGQYRFSTPDIRIDLDIWDDGTYYASMDSWGRVTEEHGVWRMDEDKIALICWSGGLQMSIRRLEPVPQTRGDTLQIVEPDSQIGRAMIFSKN